MANNGLWIGLGILAAAAAGAAVYDESEKARCIKGGGTWNGIFRGCACPPGTHWNMTGCFRNCPVGQTWDAATGTCVSSGGTATTASISIANVSISPVYPGAYAQAVITLRNSGDTPGPVTVTGITTQGGITQGHWTAQSATVPANLTTTVTMQSAGPISSIFTGQTLTGQFTLSTGGGTAQTFQVL